MASICMEFWVHYVRHRPVYAMHPDIILMAVSLRLRLYDSCVVMLTVWINGSRHEKMCLCEFPTRSDSNWPAQPQKLAWRLIFWLQKLETLHYLGSEQQRCWSDCVDAQTDLHLCCSHMTWHIFSWPGSLIFSCLSFYKRLNLFHAHKYF